MRVAIVHYWLVSMRGGEKVVEALCDMYPEADIFTLVCDEKKISEKIRRHKITTSFLQRIPGATRYYQSLLPLMPFALESLDLRGYDLIISSESGPAKGIIPPPHAAHVCYCHSPMRYLWDHYHSYRDNAGLAARITMPVLAPLLRSWDANSSLRVDRFVANSHHVAGRIRKYYRRSATVVPPPVSVEDFAPVTGVEDFYLCAGQIVPYKRIDLAVRAFSKMERKLVIIGEGAKGDVEALKRIAGPSVTFMGRTAFPVLKAHLARCRALIFPGEEDFGIVPVEAMASGRPVIAYGRGGALETVIHGQTGILFDEQSVEALIEAVETFEQQERGFRAEAIRMHAARFSLAKFRASMQKIIDDELAAKQAPGARETGMVAAPYLYNDDRPVPLH
ncbi:glycosyltransferase [Rhizobium sp. S95]|uniref:Glycosyltransferase n=1 Tax=Ciceribacter sichuanensis TaxID=2949647 RepID=A0AAJ1C0B5_9HYPH|nr:MULTISPECIES: glycosyltransferase [unclassified Ciceribacter]MCM2398148.1 glycosyltransferase [Ciceribacter sp. S95]MCM2403786.1 glycosyltransferase [Ciceribacter sp. S153]MCO5959499.1 glycosyltransferase [Ciceribacter sp. S101]